MKRLTTRTADEHTLLETFRGQDQHGQRAILSWVEMIRRVRDPIWWEQPTAESKPEARPRRKARTR